MGPGYYITYRPGRSPAYPVCYPTAELAQAKIDSLNDMADYLHVVYSDTGRTVLREEPK